MRDGNGSKAYATVPDGESGGAGVENDGADGAACEEVTAEAGAPPVCLGHVLLFLVIGVGCGVGTVVVKIGLAGTNPVVFALLRNGCAAVLMALPALAYERRATPSIGAGPLDPRSAHALPIAGCGVLLFGTNLAYTLGLKLSTAVVGAAWQCTIPIFTSAYTILLGRERFSWTKAAGFVVASGGAAVILVLGSGEGAAAAAAAAAPAAGAAKSAFSQLLGNVCFFVNTNCLALYGVCTKPIIAAYPTSPMTLTAWTFAVCAVVMVLAVQATAAIPSVHALVCPTCVASGTDWAVPASAVFGLVYMIVIFSFLQYGVINWTNGFLDTSKINAYVSLQPMFAAVAVLALVGSGFNEAHPAHPLTPPNGITALGGLGILVGLVLVLGDDFHKPAAGAAAAAGSAAAVAGDGGLARADSTVSMVVTDDCTGGDGATAGEKAGLLARGAGSIQQEGAYSALAARADDKQVGSC